MPCRLFSCLCISRSCCHFAFCCLLKAFLFCFATVCSDVERLFFLMHARCCTFPGQMSVIFKICKKQILTLILTFCMLIVSMTCQDSSCLFLSFSKQCKYTKCSVLVARAWMLMCRTRCIIFINGKNNSMQAYIYILSHSPLHGYTYTQTYFVVSLQEIRIR